MSTLTCRFLSDANPTVVDQLNDLLRILHSKSRLLDVMTLADHMTRSKIAVAEKDGVIVGMGVLSPVYLLSHVSATVSNFVTLKTSDRLDVQQGLLDLILQHVKKTSFDFVDFRVNRNRDSVVGMDNILVQQGFRERASVIYRLDLK
jgi:hypothetical protein